MSNEQAAPETKGVTTELLATVDPGGVFGPIHDHNDRPGIVYVLQGTFTDHRNGGATDYGPGVGWPEDRHMAASGSRDVRSRGTAHVWWSLGHCGMNESC
jgi:hypothetical protein